MEINDSEVID